MMKIRHLAPLSLALLAGAAFANAPAPAAKADKPQAAAKTGPEYATRDWAKIDTDKDGYISPAEMEAYLAANPGPLRTASGKK